MCLHETISKSKNHLLRQGKGLLLQKIKPRILKKKKKKKNLFPTYF